MRRPSLEGWRSVRAVAASGAIESDQRVVAGRRIVAMTDEGARELGERYWLQVRRVSLGLVRLEQRRRGSELRLRPAGVRLLCFDVPRVGSGPDGVTCAYPIRGGLLARRAGGMLVLSQSDGDQPQLRAVVTGFVPRLGRRAGYPRWTGWLYEWFQHGIHVAISRRFFMSLVSEQQS